MYKKYDLESGAFIRSANNELDIRYLITSIERILEIDAHSIIVRSKDLDSFASWIEPVRKDIDSYAYIPYIYEMLGSAKINEFNILDIIYKLAQAPIHQLKEYVNQDTYIREARPTINYGTAESLIVGSTLEGKYRSLIQLDLTNYHNLENVKIIEVSLVLDVTGAYNPNLIIDAYEVYSSWNENNITWSSAITPPTELNISAEPVFSFNVTDSVIHINIQEYIDSLKNQNKNKLNIMLKVRDEESDSLFNFFSKDTQIIESRPYLDVKYQDPTWTGFISDSSLDGQSVIRLGSNKEVIGSSIVRRREFTEISGGVLVGRWKDKDLDQQANIRHTHNYDLDQQGTIVYSQDIESEIFVRGKRELEGNAVVLHGKNLESSAHVLSSVNIDGSAVVLNSTDMLSGAVLSKKLDLDSTVLIRDYKFLDGHAVVTYGSDLQGGAIVGNWMEIDIDSNTVIHPNTSIVGNTTITYKFDLDGNVVVKSSSNITGEATVVRSKDIESLANIFRKMDLESDVIITRSVDLEGNAVVVLTSDLFSIILIGNWSDTELDSSATVNAVRNADLNQEANIVYRGNSDFDGDVNVLPQTSIIGQTVIRQKTHTDLIHDSIVRQFDIREIDSSGYCIGLYFIALNGEVVIRRIGRDYLDCEAEITTRARRWIPNVHGIDKFKYEDRKLPRQWKREQFIP